MSSDVYAGQLCATHVKGRVSHPDLDPERSWWIEVITHSASRPTVRVVALSVNYDELGEGRLRKRSLHLDLEPDDIVTVAT